MSATLEIGSLYDALRERLGLEWINGENCRDRVLHTSRDESADISLIGHLNLIHQHRIQVLGTRELEFLDELKKNSRKDAIAQLLSGQTRLIIVARGRRRGARAR